MNDREQEMMVQKVLPDFLGECLTCPLRSDCPSEVGLHSTCGFSSARKRQRALNLGLRDATRWQTNRDDVT